MTIYDLIYVMDNMNFDIIVHNDADTCRCGPTDDGKVFEGEISDFCMSDLYDNIHEEEVTDLYTLADGRLVICYYNKED